MTASVRRYLYGAFVFTAALFASHRLVLFAYNYLTARFGMDIDCPPHWPFSIFNPRGPHGVWEWGAIAASVAVGAGGVWRLPKRGFPAGEAAAFGFVLVLLTNAIQGVPKGFYNPIAGGISGEQYYHDSLRITGDLGGGGAFLRDFNTLQPTLRTHARTHPPGAVLLFWGLHRLAGLPPAGIAVVIAAFTVGAYAWAFPQFARSLLPALSPQMAGYGTLLLLFLPATQIYACATLDAVIAALLLLVAALWLRPPTVTSTVLAAVVVTAASFLTFGFAWVLPVLVALDVAQKRRQWGRIATVGLVMAAVYGTLKVVWGFDYVAALRMASHLENPHGFRGTAEPVSFCFTRLEDVTEMVAFWGPFLLVLALQGASALRQKRFWAARGVVLAAVGTLALLFATGAYHTGETARACQFLYPYLLLPVLAALNDKTERERLLVAALVLVQAVAMQMWGNWFW